MGGFGFSGFEGGQCLDLFLQLSVVVLALGLVNRLVDLEGLVTVYVQIEIYIYIYIYIYMWAQGFGGLRICQGFRVHKAGFTCLRAFTAARV